MMEFFESVQKEDEELLEIEEVVPLPNGKIIRNHYKLLKFITEDQHCRYFEVACPDDTVSIIKIISKSDLNRYSKKRLQLLNEIQNHRKLNHKNIIKFMHIFEDSLNVYIILERCIYGSIEQLLSRRIRISQTEAQFYLDQMIQILAHLKSYKVMHRNIKTQTLLLGKDFILKLSDFSECSKVLHDQPNKSIIKFTTFSSPEIISNLGHSYETDMWSMGVVLYTMLTGYSPFKSPELFSINKIKNADFLFDQSIKLHWKWQQILKGMLVADPQKRITVEKLKQYSIKFNSNKPYFLDNSLLSVPNRITQYQKNNKSLHTSSQVFTKLHKINFSTSSSTNNNNNNNNNIQYSLNTSSNKAEITQKFEQKITNNTPSHSSGFVNSFIVGAAESTFGLQKWILNQTSGLFYSISGILYWNTIDNLIWAYAGGIDIKLLTEKGDKKIIKQTEISEDTLYTLRQYYQFFNLNNQEQLQEQNSSFYFISKIIKVHDNLIFKFSNGIYQVNLDQESYALIEDQKVVFVGTPYTEQRCREVLKLLRRGLRVKHVTTEKISIVTMNPNIKI